MGTTKKTKDQLAKETTALQRKVRKLQKNGAKRGEQEERHRSLVNNLSERLKELNCLYSISKIHKTPAVTLKDFIQSILEQIPPALQNPEIACARLVVGKRRYSTDNFDETSCQIVQETTLSDGITCVLTVCYLENEPGREPPSFLKEEEQLLEAIQDQIKSKLDLHFELKRAEKQQEQLLQLDKMVALGTLVSGVAHEINNPNNFIMLNTPLLSEAWRDVLPILDEYAESNGDFLVGGLSYSEIRDNVGPLFDGIIDGANRIKSIVEGLKSFARADAPDRVPGVDVNATVRAALLLVNNQVKRATDHLRVVCDDKLPQLVANAQRLEQVWVNLVQNACESLANREKEISVLTRYDERDECIIVEVRDQGVGISDDNLQKVMDPFFTTKRDAGGTGLGLSISSGIVTNHGGTLSLESNSAGTVATVRFPKESVNSNGREMGK